MYKLSWIFKLSLAIVWKKYEKGIITHSFLNMLILFFNYFVLFPPCRWLFEIDETRLFLMKQGWRVLHWLMSNVGKNVDGVGIWTHNPILIDIVTTDLATGARLTVLECFYVFFEGLRKSSNYNCFTVNCVLNPSYCFNT